ncbi:hypothetical protein PG994_005468 [Apiospora phragmitis]|uniref:Uncharacterized protein n=1 Tax=Apiospora phragmitis TaxID=2905665 RepID=A0ABR1VCB4_9PEZI
MARDLRIGLALAPFRRAPPWASYEESTNMRLLGNTSDWSEGVLISTTSPAMRPGKKIVYDFIHHGAWKDKSARVLWLQLQRLKIEPKSGYTLDGDFSRSIFPSILKAGELSRELCGTMANAKYKDAPFIFDQKKAGPANFQARR